MLFTVFTMHNSQILLFDAHKLDISDELKTVIRELKPFHDKLRVVLNKADTLPNHTLMRVYGALMFSLAKVIDTPEVPKVHIGSYWSKSVNEAGRSNADLFKAEEADLLADLKGLPRSSAVRKVNELVKRARLAKVHALLITKLRSDMPLLWGHKKTQDRLAEKLEEHYTKVSKAHGLARGDFPAPARFRAGLDAFELSEFPALSKRMLDVLDGALARDIPALLLSLGETAEEYTARENAEVGGDMLAGANPFAEKGTGLEEAAERSSDAELTGVVPWTIGPAAKKKWDAVFETLGPTGNPPAVSGAAVRGMMIQSGLPAQTLKRIWDLSDIDRDGLLDSDEFAVAMQLIRIGRTDGGIAIPSKLSPAFIPPSKR
jgi:Domain of unknown function (DUF5600)/Cytoskeletal-regulatory complex EF hand